MSKKKKDKKRRKQEQREAIARAERKISDIRRNYAAPPHSYALWLTERDVGLLLGVMLHLEEADWVRMKPIARQLFNTNIDPIAPQFALRPPEEKPQEDGTDV